MNRKPSWLIVFCVFAITFGALGLFGALSTVATTLGGDAFESFAAGMQPQMPPNDAYQQTLERAEEETQAVADRFKWINLSLAGVNFLLSALLLIGGILALQLKPPGWPLLIGAFLASAIYECVAIGPYVMQLQEMFAIQGRMMAEIQSSGPQNQAMPPQANDFMTTWMNIMGTAAVVFASVWTAAKLIAYVGGFLYFRRPAIRTLYAAEPGFGTEAAEIEDFDDLGQWDDRQP